MAATAWTGVHAQFFDTIVRLNDDMAFWMNYDGYWAEMVACRCFETTLDHQPASGSGYDRQVLEYVWGDDFSIFQHTTRPDCRYGRGWEPRP